MISKKFLKSSFLYTVSGALPMASMVLLLPFYLLLPVEEFGALALYTTFATLLQIIITYSFDMSLFVYYHDFKHDQDKLAVFVSSCFVLIGIAGLTALAVSLVSGDFFFRTVYAQKGVSFFPYGLMSVVTAIFQAFFKVHSSFIQSREKPVLFFWSNVLSFSLIASLTLAGLLLFPKTLIGPVGGRMAAAVLSGSWALFRILREFGFHFNFPMLRTSFALNNSSFIYQVQQWVINSFDRILIAVYLTLTDVGTYDLAFKCMLMITFITDGLNNSILPKVMGIVTAQPVKESTVATNRYYYGMVAVTMLLVCGIIVGLPLAFDVGLIPLKYNNYRVALKYVPFIGVLYFIRSMRYYFVLPFGALKYVRPLPVISLIISGIKVLLMISLIRYWNVYAVIASAGVSALLEISLFYYVLKDKFHFRFNLFKLIIAPVSLGAIIVVAEQYVPGNEHIRHGLYLVLCIALLGWAYRNELKLMRPAGFLK